MFGVLIILKIFCYIQLIPLKLGIVATLNIFRLHFVMRLLNLTDFTVIYNGIKL